MEEVPVAKTSDIPPGERKFFDISGNEVAIINDSGTYHAVRNSCPHMGAPVARGPVEKSTNDCDGGECERTILSCPFHGWRFDLDSGKAVFNENTRVRKYEVTVVDDEIVVRI
jgi:3-phenylpropionate/trans-cinnamate dioxygenase ferredoxin subunit